MAEEQPGWCQRGEQVKGREGGRQVKVGRRRGRPQGAGLRDVDAGGITDVHSVEFGGMSILGIYTQGCTIVYGN